MQLQQKITPFLSFKSQAEEAAKFYVSVIPNSKIKRTVKNPADGNVMIVEFQLAGLDFVALNAGQPWEFTHAFSLSIACETQDEIDMLWSKLSAGGKEVHCGWLTDKFGMSWQIVPQEINKWMSDPDTVKSGRMMAALMQMTKLDAHQLKRAFDGD